MSWTFARAEDLPALAQLLGSREWECVSLTSRIHREGRLELPRGAAGVAIYKRNGEIQQAVYMSRGGLHIPFLPAPPSIQEKDRQQLEDLFFQSGGAAACLMGMEEYLETFLAALDIHPPIRIAYHMMRLPHSVLPPSPSSRRGLRIRQAGPADLELLFPLQEAYEREEVLLQPQLFDPALCRQGLERSLRTQCVYLAEYRGQVVAKGGTNARGLGYDQIGGVFTLPAFRGRGIGAKLMEDLLAHIFRRRRGACLFVKKSNTPALGLYKKCDFTIAGSFGIHYF